ncbi:MAG: serine protease AprX [Acidobacteriota bacterium]|jgi:subtilisin family serine protease|nr:serine protease AprX [Acidobacteriota bacterium]
MAIDKVGPELQFLIDRQKFDVNILVHGTPVVAGAPVEPSPVDRPTAVAEIISRVTGLQHDLLADLETSAARSFWLNNTISATVDRQTLDRLAARPDVLQIEVARRLPLQEILDLRPDLALLEDAFAALAGLALNDSEPIPSVTLIGAPQVWAAGITGTRSIVAVIDTGVHLDHPDLVNRLWDGGPDFPDHGFNFETPDTPPKDDNGHGTSTAGLIAGEGKVGKATGTAPGAKLMALRVGNEEGQAWGAFEFALTHGAHVICMPMTWPSATAYDRERWRRACETVLALGVLHANSTGKDGGENPDPPIPMNIGIPGSCPPPRLHPLQVPRAGVSSAISCGATTPEGRLLGSSGRGPVAWEVSPFADYPFANGQSSGLIKPDLCAPGAGIFSTNSQFENGLGPPHTSAFGTGTSPATAAIAGCLALLADACLAAGKPIVPARILEALESTAVPIPGQTKAKENSFGAGQVDVQAAFEYGREPQRGWWG